MPYLFKSLTGKKHLVSTLLLVFVSSCPGLWAQDENYTRVAFYNLENIWHPSNDSLKRDDEFTPDGMRNWSFYRYHDKLNKMAKAIRSIGGWNPPDIIGFAEVENRQVLEDLRNTAVLRPLQYHIVHYESPDRRGIDVCAFYRKENMEMLHHHAQRVRLPGNPNYATRDILYLKALSQGDTLHLIYCHWPSRYGGQKISEPKRIAAARTVRRITDSIKRREPAAALIIMGDLNDEWNNISIMDTLAAKPTVAEAEQNGSQLLNLMATLDESIGTHRYRGRWGYLDQIIVSTAMLGEAKPHLSKLGAVVVRHPFLLEQDEKYPGQKPFRSFIGMRYNGGFSDHLPVYIDVLH